MLLTLSVPFLFAQNSGIPLGTEMQNIEKALGASGLSGAARYESLVRLANLRELSGDIEGAAKAWFEAAEADPAGSGASPGDALVSGAYCLAYMGEWPRAAAAIGTVLLAGRPGDALTRARFLGACAEAWNGADPRALAALADNAEFAGLRPSIYYALWKFSAANSGAGNQGAETWKARLLAEFPQSPEGRIAAAENKAALVSARPSPMWLLLPGRAGFALAPPAAAAPAAGGAPLLQTGLFSREANAQAHADRLRSAGFAPAIIRRAVRGAEYWAVTVPPGADINRTIMELKNAGFESFPVFSNNK
jgi:hypothetical protein